MLYSELRLEFVSLYIFTALIPFSLLLFTFLRYARLRLRFARYDKRHNVEMRSISAVCKTVKIRARHEGRDFSDGSVQVVRDQTARNNNAVVTQSVKTAEMRAVQEARGKLAGSVHRRT